MTAVRSGLASDPATEYYYDGFKQVTKVRAPYGDDGAYAEVATYLDGASQATKVEDALGNVTTMQYDVDRQLTKATDALAGTWVYNWDLAHAMTRLVDPNGNVTTKSGTTPDDEPLFTAHDSGTHGRDSEHLFAHRNSSSFMCFGQNAKDLSKLYPQIFYKNLFFEKRTIRVHSRCSQKQDRILSF
jgi:YD repeat-containing protein